MLTRALTLGIALFSATTASAQVISMLDLVPQTPGPYGPAETVEVDIFFVNNEGEDIELRLITLDFSRTTSALGLPETFTFDASTLVGDYLYTRFEIMPKVDIVYTSPAPLEGFIITVADGQAYFVGTIEVITPMRSGSYLLDAINSAAPDINFGARLTYGFEGRTDLHYLNTSLTGGVVAIVVDFEGCFPPDCDDGIACTLDHCDSSTNICTNERRDFWCGDDDTCTVDTCDPENASADEFGCVYTVLGPCCVDGIPENCDDGIACTADRCDYLTNTCTSEPRNSSCNDSDQCTADTCDPDNASSDARGCVSELIVPCCGDGVCEAPEEPCTCSFDCGVCCGDGTCDDPEDRCTCPEDCGSCPVCEAVQGVEGSVAAVDRIRRYRTEVLSRSQSGRRLIGFYDEQAEEIVRIMLENRDLLRRTRALLADLEPAVGAVVDGDRVALTEYQVVEMHGLLDDFESEAGPELSLAIQEVRRFVGSAKLMVQVGWIIDPERRRPGR